MGESRETRNIARRVQTLQDRFYRYRVEGRAKAVELRDQIIDALMTLNTRIDTTQAAATQAIQADRARLAALETAVTDLQARVTALEGTPTP